MRFNSFCGVVSLQVGVAIISAIFITFAVLITFINGFDYHKQEGFPLAVILVLFFIIVLAIIAFLAFAGAYWEARPTIMCALLIFVLLIVYWIILSILSFINDPVILRKVCVGERCAETLWMIHLRYRNNTLKNDSDTGESKDKDKDKGARSYMLLAQAINLDDTSKNKKVSTNASKRRKIYDDNSFNSNIFNDGFKESLDPGNNLYSELGYNYTAINELQIPYNSSGLLGINTEKLKNTWNKFWNNMRDLILFQDKTESKKDKDEEKEEWEAAVVPGWPLFGGIFMFIATLIFFLFSACIFWSFAQQLEEEYDEYDDDNETIEYYDERSISRSRY